MTEAVRMSWGAHEAYLDAMTGEGLLVRPRAADDLAVGAVSLHAADWDAAVRDLDRLGWELTDDEDGGLCLVGVTGDGREAVGLYGREPVTASPSLAECARASVELARMAGVVTEGESRPAVG